MTDEIKEDTPVIQEPQSQDQIIPPIPVTIVNNNSEQIDQKQKEFFEHYDLLVQKMKEVLNLFPKHGKGRKALDWFLKHAWTTVLISVFGIGIIIGIQLEQNKNYNDMIRAVNLQRFEFKGDLFEIQPSTIKKYYNGEEKNLSSIIPTIKKEDSVKVTIAEPTTKPIK